VYVLIADKANHLRELGMSDKAIARALGVSDKTVAKAISEDRGTYDPPATPERDQGFLLASDDKNSPPWVSA
jgi:predicted transcriptional regulator